MNDTEILVGKRIPIGVMCGGFVSFVTWLWNAKNPDLQVPAEIAVGVATLLTGCVQVIIVNLFGVTVRRSKDGS